VFFCYPFIIIYLELDKNYAALATTDEDFANLRDLSEFKKLLE